MPSVLFQPFQSSGAPSMPMVEAIIRTSETAQSAEDLRGRLPGVKPAGISSLAALAEVSHPAVVS